MIGDYFINKCKSTTAETAPWPHQYFANTFPEDSFKKLRECCENIKIKNVGAGGIEPPTRGLKVHCSAD